ncbi:hypothetical protein BABINDRAFT_161850 [Babjeviella inositovora NRRL Y-12698]|uniref:Calponin-homology (CH) domain-containing protein n=1 Tax=Babjeviella inositovora NRRL Y-12698 TaxID=984486 RepID=A0A1E3QQW0_9ASCO|nr:uncharacterized protein BABINDRAFT_161850 [Babjeviella inositovora NRRL Y-12698]ODQ79452.1 hypothetical protein BABINDRAFT_161850 [Babjeviella inositovora NRRL Y-12698]
MTSPAKSIASRYLESVGDGSPSKPLGLSSRVNTFAHKTTNTDLDILSSQLQENLAVSPSKTSLIKSRFENSPTVSAFKSKFDQPPAQEWSTPKARTTENWMSPTRQTGYKQDRSERLNFELAKPLGKPSKQLVSPSHPKPSATPSHSKPLANSTTPSIPLLSPTKPGFLIPPSSSDASANGAMYKIPLKNTRSRSASPSKTFQALLTPKTASSPQRYTDDKSEKIYLYLCRVAELKAWIETCIGESIPSIYEMPDNLRNGVIVAKLTKVFAPHLIGRIYESLEQKFFYTENITNFFKFLQFVQMPTLFSFELTDLYDGKNIPKVIFCLHALAHILHLNGNGPKLEKVTELDDLDEVKFERVLRAIGNMKLPNFDSIEAPMKSPVRMKPLLNQPLPPVFEPEEEMTVIEREASPVPTPPSVPSSFPIRSPSPVADFLEVLDEPTQVIPQPSQVTPPDELHRYLQTIVSLQALARGSLFRYNMFIDKYMVRKFLDTHHLSLEYRGADLPITPFHAVVKGHLLRRRLARQKAMLSLFAREISEFQAIARAHLRQASFSSSVRGAGDSTDAVRALQAVIRGNAARQKATRTVRALALHEREVTLLQSVVRLKPVRRNTRSVIENKNVAEPHLVRFQALARGHLVAMKHQHMQAAIKLAVPSVVALQSVLRGAAVRNSFESHFEAVTISCSYMVDFQAIIRGGLARNRLNHILDVLYVQEPRTEYLMAIARGKLVRRDVYATSAQLLNSQATASITAMQALVRGVLSRFYLDCLMDNVEDTAPVMVGFQATARGALVRAQHARMIRYYHANVNTIIKVQSYLRGKSQLGAYRSLTKSGDINVAVIRKFAPLLDDATLDFDEQMTLQRLTDSIADYTKNNEAYEAKIEQLEIKLGLLHKNEITLEEFKSHALLPSQTAGGRRNVFSALTKNSVDRIEVYKSMFYLLQVRPHYFASAFARLLPDSKQYHEVEETAYTVLNPTAGVREEFLFVQLLVGLLSTEIQSCDHLEVHDGAWSALLCRFHQTANQKRVLKEFAYEFVSSVLENEDVDFEANPSSIYLKLVQAQERVTGRPSDRPVRVNPQEAMADKLTHDTYIRNMMNLRDYTSPFIQHISDHLGKLALHVRVLCRQVYDQATQKFPGASEMKKLAVVGKILVRYYISDILLDMASYGVDTSFLSGTGRVRVQENLVHVAKLLAQLFELRHFGPLDRHYHSLNSFIDQNTPTVVSVLRCLIDVPAPEQAYNMTMYDDLTAATRPVLVIKCSEMLAIHQMVKREINALVPPSASMNDGADPLRECVVKLNTINVSAPEVAKISQLGEISLQLSPSAFGDGFSSKKIKHLLVQAKRYVLYHIRVQRESDDLLEMLILKIGPEHERRFRELVDGGRKSLNSSTRTVEDSAALTYVEVRKLALATLLELEELREVTRANGFHEVLVQLATDIRTKHDQRLGRKKQLSQAAETNQRLENKHKALVREYADFKRFIDRLLVEGQSQKTGGKRWFHFLSTLTKQYLQHREFRRMGFTPKFGYHKFSARKLMDQVVLIDVKGLESGGKSAFGSSKLDFVFSSDQAGVFKVECLLGSFTFPDASQTVTLDDLLQAQFEGRREFEMFKKARFDTDNLIKLIKKKFYESA